MMYNHIFCRLTGIANTYCYSPTASCWHLCYLIPSFFFEVITLHTANRFRSLSAHYKKYLIIKKTENIGKTYWRIFLAPCSGADMQDDTAVYCMYLYTQPAPFPCSSTFNRLSLNTVTPKASNPKL